jgi:hypothetical protein
MRLFAPRKERLAGLAGGRRRGAVANCNSEQRAAEFRAARVTAPSVCPSCPRPATTTRCKVAPACIGPRERRRPAFAAPAWLGTRPEAGSLCRCTRTPIARILSLASSRSWVISSAVIARQQGDVPPDAASTRRRMSAELIPRMMGASPPAARRPATCPATRGPAPASSRTLACTWARSRGRGNRDAAVIGVALDDQSEQAAPLGGVI